jgi:Mrp family chromosome partitioning ATPase
LRLQVSRVQPSPGRPIVDGLSPSAEFDAWVGAEAQPRGALDSYLRAIRAHRLLVVVVVLATVIASIVWLSQRTPEYNASARVLINPLPQTDEFLGLPVIRDSGDPTRTMQTAASLLESPEAARATADQLGGDWTAEKVLDAVDLQPEGESNILAVTARADGKGAAVDLANAFADATLEERNAALSRDVAPIIARLNQARARLGPSDPSAADIQNRIVTLEELAAVGDPSTELSRRAGPSASVAGAPPWLVVFLALVAGVVLGSVAALLKEMLGPRTIRDGADLQEANATPVLAQIPATKKRRRQRRQSALAAPPSARASFRSLEFQLGESPRAVLFTSASPRDGTTTCLINFALELASSGREVVLLDLDLSKPTLASRLGAAGDGDLRAVLGTDADLKGGLVPMLGVPAIKVLPGIADAERATLENVGRRLPGLIAEARSNGAYVLVDTSSLGEVGDALRFAPAVDDVVVVVLLDHTSVDEVQVARDQLDRIRKPPTGFIVVGGRPSGLGRQQRGADIAPNGGDPEPPSTEMPVQALGDLVEAGLLPHDAELVARTNRREHFARLEGEQVNVNGKRYGSLSAAATSITGRATDGWTFWQTRVDGEYVPLAALRSRLRPRG